MGSEGQVTLSVLQVSKARGQTWQSGLPEEALGEPYRLQLGRLPS
jgi:hypothetical protein